MYKEVIEINGQKLTKKYIASLNKEQRIALINPIFEYFRKLGWQYPDFNKEMFLKSYQKLIDFEVDISKDEAYGNVSLATDICQYFCRTSYLNSTERENGKVFPTMIENFNDDEKLKKICWNRLGLGWYDNGEINETFNITPKMIMYQGQRSMRLVPHISFFKPSIAKTIYVKYSKENDLVYDYSCGFGARALGALSCNRRYIGIDPLTANEVVEMLKFLNISENKYKIINGISEELILDENSIDFAFSSPPYYDQEYYSSDYLQAYNKTEDYFYNIYWKKTLENIKLMLKKGKYFALNISNSYKKMIELAEFKFGKPVETFKMRLVKSHLNKYDGKDYQKYEPIYIFKN